LSREIIVLNFFAVIAALLLFFPQFSFPASWQALLVRLVAGIALASVFTSAMVYVDTQRPLWSPGFTFGNFFGTTLLLGATFTALVFEWTGFSKTDTHTLGLIATMIRTLLFLWRGFELFAASRDSGSPIHFNSCIIRELLPWTIPVQTSLFAVSTLFGVLALFGSEPGGAFWLCLSTLTTFCSEIIARYIFFAGGASKRMPGGIAS
jgi:DMSO reductase anchor subunit